MRDGAPFNDPLVSALTADRDSRTLGSPALGADADFDLLLFVAGLFDLALKAPVLGLCGQPMALTVANMVEDDCVSLIRSQSQASSNLLNVQASRCRWPEHKATTDTWCIESFANKVHAT